MINFVTKSGGGALDPIRRPPPVPLRAAADGPWAACRQGAAGFSASGGGALDPIRRPPPVKLDADNVSGEPQLQRKLYDLQIHFISLVPAPANQRTLLVKSAESSGRTVVEKQIAIIKTDTLRRVVYGIVYAPDEVDTDGDTVNAQEIEEAAYQFMRSRRTGQVDADHDGVAGKGFVAESWLIRSGDPLFPFEPAGAWAAGIKVTDDATWQRIERGELRGISMAGVARAEAVGSAHAAVEAAHERDGEARGVLMRLRKMLGLEGVHNGSFQPDQDAVNAQLESILKAVSSREDALRDLSRRAQELQARLEALEQHSPGRQSRLGGSDAVRKSKRYRGVRIV